MKFSAILVSSLLSTVAMAQDINVSNYTLNDPNGFYSVTTDNYNYYTGPITLKTTTGSLNVYCADLDHTIYPNTNYTYSVQNLTENGLGQKFSQSLSNELGQISSIGQNAFSAKDYNLATAAQAAIWGLEYNTTSEFTDAAVENDYNHLVNAVYKNDGTWAKALVPVGTNWPINGGATQQMILNVPELPSWLMFILGFGMFALVSKRKLIKSLEV